MKRSFQIHSARLDCDIQFTYTSNNSLCGFQVMDDKDRTVDEIAAILNTAITLEALQEVCKKHKICLIEILADLSFAAFWTAYNYKDGGSKKKAELLWNKLPEGKRATAIAYLPTYEQHLRQHSTAKAYATTYLNQEYWEK